MLKTPTLFVVGAGASNEFGLPVGANLADEISTALDIRFGDFGQTWAGRGDRQIYAAFKQIAQQKQENSNDYLHACWLVRDGIQLSYSIDNFLDKHAAEPKVQIVGRLAFVKRILEAERASKLFVDPGNIYNTINFQGVANTWIVSLFKMIQDKVRLKDVADIFKDVKFVTFNYDRCIEHFLFHALKRNYGINDAEASGLMKSLEIEHIYGRVGRLPWEANSTEPEVAFGEGERAPISLLWPSIRTYADERNDDAVVDRVRTWMREAGQALFLGFSYQEQNLDILSEQLNGRPRTILGSTYRISPYNSTAIERDIVDRFGDETHVVLASETCEGLLNSYSRMLV